MAADTAVAINGRSGNALVVINSIDFSCRLFLQEYESVVPQEKVLTFCSETAPKFEPGDETMTFRIAGYGTYNAANSAPFIPLSSLQGVSYVGTIDTGCTVSGTVNFSRGMLRRQSGVRATIAGEGVFTGTVVVAWDLSGT
jgi:hypothetical protein